MYRQLEKRSLEDKLSLAQHSLVFLSSFLISLIVSLIVYSAMKQFYITVFHENDRLGLYHLYSRSLVTAGGFILIYSVYISNRYYSKSLSLELKEEQFQRELLEMKYQLLSNKMNPHFLFNNLNTLHTLISEDSRMAENFLVSLSKIMRYSFKPHDNDIVRLSEELETLKDYVLIIKSRFDNALNLSLENETDSKGAILPMSLLNLMENAVKHNEITSQRPLNVHISINSQRIVFTNSRAPKIAHDSSGSGLKHLKEVYAQKYKREVLVEKTEDEFKVTLPVIQE